MKKESDAKTAEDGLGAGRPRGLKSTKTLEKQWLGKYGRQVVTEHLDSFLAAQIDNAVGVPSADARLQCGGRFERVTGSAEQIDQALKQDTAVCIYTKDPNVQAFRACRDGGPLVIRLRREEEPIMKVV